MCNYKKDITFLHSGIQHSGAVISHIIENNIISNKSRETLEIENSIASLYLQTSNSASCNLKNARQLFAKKKTYKDDKLVDQSRHINTPIQFSLKWFLSLVNGHFGQSTYCLGG